MSTLFRPHIETNEEKVYDRVFVYTLKDKLIESVDYFLADTLTWNNVEKAGANKNSCSSSHEKVTTKVSTLFRPRHEKVEKVSTRSFGFPTPWKSWKKCLHFGSIASHEKVEKVSTLFRPHMKNVEKVSWTLFASSHEKVEKVLTLFRPQWCHRKILFEKVSTLFRPSNNLHLLKFRIKCVLHFVCVWLS